MATPKIGLCHGKGFVSALIRWQTWGDYSHALLLLPDGETVLESWQGKGVRKATLKSTEGITWFEVPSMTAEQWAKTITWMESKIGHGYDWWGIIRFISRARMPDNDDYSCAEYAFDGIKFGGGVELFERVDGFQISPSLFAISPLLKYATEGVAISKVTPL